MRAASFPAPKPFEWEPYFYRWSDRLEDFGLDPARLTTTVHVSANFTRYLNLPKALWWRRADVQRNLVLLNAALEMRALRSELYPDGEPNRGVIETALDLKETDGKADENCALLTLASFHPRFCSVRRNGPSELVDHASYKAVRDACVELGGQGPWIGRHTDTLPTGHSYDGDYDLRTFLSLARYLAEEHAAALCKYAVVVLQPVERLSDEMLAAIARLQEERAAAEAADERRHAEWWQAREAERAAAVTAQAERLGTVNARRASAGYEPLKQFGNWRTVEDEELQRLVWSMPITFVAEQFGVSDVAVHKTLKARGIAKPPQGFWSKVAAGKIPHPNGVPQG